MLMYKTYEAPFYFLISKIYNKHLIFFSVDIKNSISWYQEMNSWYQEMNFLISRNIFWYQEIDFLISRNRIFLISRNIY